MCDSALLAFKERAGRRTADCRDAKPRRVQRMSLADAKSDVFIIRIWHEPREGEASETIWRGSAEYLGTKEVRHFQDMATLVAFMTGHAGIPDDCV